MSFCGRRTYTDANGKCHIIVGMKVNEILALVESSDHDHLEGHEDHNKEHNEDHNEDNNE